MPKSALFRNWLIAFVVCGASALFCINHVDRPVADYAHVHLIQTVSVGLLDRMLTGLALIAGLAFVFLIAAGCWKIARHSLPQWTEVPLVCSWSLMWSMASAEVLKRVFGRADPDLWTGPTPGGPHLGVYGFHLLRNGTQFASFPSGTMSVAAAVLAVLWIMLPRERWFWAIAFALIGVSLVTTNSHFVSDVIAGAFLGSLLGWLTAILLRVSDACP